VPLLFSILGLLGIPVGVYIFTVAIRAGLTVWGWAWMLAYVLLDFAALSAQNSPYRAKVTFGAFLVLLGVIVGARHSRAHATEKGMVIQLPTATQGPWIDRLGDDGDLGMMTFIVMSDFGGVRTDDRRRAKAYLRAAWNRLRRDPDYAPIPSPIPSNLLSRTSGTNLHTLVLNMQPRAPRSVIFLHGTGGSSKLPCYLLARRMPDALVLCPSIGMGGEWANSEGTLAWQHTLSYAREHAEAVYVIGSGYGGRGVLHLLSSSLLGHVSGAVLLSGFDENYFDAVRRSEIPLLIIRGDQDARTPAFRVEGLARLDRVQNMEFPAGHYVLYEQEDEVLQAIDSFCGGH
jgi:pimeloyl-ACP methyl ester carboxylesterase